jgi:hypothetical protein
MERSRYFANSGKTLPMKRLTLFLLLLLLVAPRVAARGQDRVPATATSAPLASSSVATSALIAPTVIAIGESVVPLNGPWKFHTGDDSRWADPNFDDSAWETLDLTAPPGAHDSDVGLSGYVPGWTSHGHRGYWGYAWYRLRMSVSAPAGDTLALAGPPDVDSAYQVFFNGELLGSAGKFSGSTPVAYSIQPRFFPLPQLSAPALRENGNSAVLAFRVWMGPWGLDDPEGGGIHIAPTLGEMRSVTARYDLQWLETISGYIVEVVEALLFVLLAVMACSLMAFDRSNHAYLWISAALLLTAMYRANQAIFFWGQFETVHEAELVSIVLLVPLVLGAWTMAWHAWFKLADLTWMPVTVGVLTSLYIGAQFVAGSWFHGSLPHEAASAAGFISTCVRLLFVVLMLVIVYRGVRQRGREAWLSLLALILVSIGLFAQELSSLHIPGIWFPFGTGVSRTQFVYAAFDVALFALFLRQLKIFAARQRHAT